MAADWVDVTQPPSFTRPNANIAVGCHFLRLVELAHALIFATVTNRSDSTPDDATSPSEVAARYLARHDWRRHGKNGSEPPGGALSLWERWIPTEPERAWAVVLELVRLRPADDEVLEQVWYRVRQFLRRHGSAFQARVLKLVASNDRLKRIARPHELKPSHYQPAPLDIPKLVDAWLRCSLHSNEAHELRALIREDPDAAWPLVVEVVHRGPLHGLTAFETIDPLRGLLRQHGAAVIERLEHVAPDSVLLRRCLWRMRASQQTPPTEYDIPADVWSRVERATHGTTDYNTDDPPARPQSLVPDAERLVEAWFAYQTAFWALERLRDLLTNDPEVAWHVIGLLIQHAPSEERLGHIGAGPLEDLLSDQGETFIDRIEAAARGDRRVRICLASVWETDMAPAIWERVVAARAADWE